MSTITMNRVFPITEKPKSWLHLWFNELCTLFIWDCMKINTTPCSFVFHHWIICEHMKREIHIWYLLQVFSSLHSGPELFHCCYILINMKWTHMSGHHSVGLRSFCWVMTCFGLKLDVVVLNGELLNWASINTHILFSSVRHVIT